MTKQELVNDLEGKGFVGAIESITGGDLVHKKLDVKVYEANIFEVVGKVAKGRSVYIYVQNEGKEGERAFYKDQEPEQTVNKVV